MRTREMMLPDAKPGKRTFGCPSISRFQEINDRLAEIVRESRKIRRPKSTDYRKK